MCLGSLVLLEAILESTTGRLHGHARVSLLLSLLLLLFRKVVVARRVASTVQLLLVAQLLLFARLVGLRRAGAHVLLRVLVELGVFARRLHGLLTRHSADLVRLTVRVEPAALRHLVVAQCLLGALRGAVRVGHQSASRRAAGGTAAASKRLTAGCSGRHLVLWRHAARGLAPPRLRHVLLRQLRHALLHLEGAARCRRVLLGLMHLLA